MSTHTHSFSHRHLGQTLLECQRRPVLWLQIIAYRPVASGSVIANYVLLSLYSETEWRAFAWVITVSILIVHYYHIIILGGEILILLVTVWESFPWYDAVFALRGRVRTFWEAVAEFLKRVPPSPDCIARAPHSRVSHTTSNEMPCQDTHTHLLYVCTLTHSNLLVLVVLFCLMISLILCILLSEQIFFRADVIKSALVTALDLCIWLWCVYLQSNSS